MRSWNGTPSDFHFLPLLRRLGDADNDVRYAAYLEADALTDDEFLRLAETWAGLATERPQPFQQFCSVAWYGALCAIIAAGLLGNWANAAWAALAVVIVSRLVEVWRGVRSAALGLLSSARYPIERILARLIARRSDARLLGHCFLLHDKTQDELARQYVVQSLRNLLPALCPNELKLLHAHQRILAKILLRPLHDVALTLGALHALDLAGDKRGLDYVKSIAYVYERDLEAWEHNRTLERGEGEHREYLDGLRHEIHTGREGYTLTTRPIDRSYSEFVESDEYVPRLGHLDTGPRYIPPPSFLPGQSDDLRRIIEAARVCVRSIEERLLQEQHATSLLHPSGAPTAPPEELVRPAADVKSAVAELLRPDGRR